MLFIYRESAGVDTCLSSKLDGIKTHTVYHIKTYLTDVVAARGGGTLGDADTLRKSALSEVENIEYVLIWFNGCSGTLECLGWL